MRWSEENKGGWISCLIFIQKNMTCQRAAAELNWAEEDGGGWLVCATIGGTWAVGE